MSVALKLKTKDQRLKTKDSRSKNRRRKWGVFTNVFYDLRFWIGGLLISSLFVSCGYSTRSSLPPRLKMIHVEVFKNEIDFTQGERRNLYFPLMEVKMRNAIADRFLFDGNLKIAEGDDADLVLKGVLKNYDRGALRYEENSDVQEYRVQIFVSLELWDVEKQEIVWQEPNFVGESTYFVTGSLAKSESVAVDEAMTDLARRIVERTIEDW